MLLTFGSLRERGLAVQPDSFFSSMASTPQKPMVIKPQVGCRQAATGTRCRPRAYCRNALFVLLCVRSGHPGLVGGGSVARACQRRSGDFRQPTHCQCDERHAEQEAARQKQIYAGETKAELEDHHGADAFPQSVPTTLLHRALCL